MTAGLMLMLRRWRRRWQRRRYIKILIRRVGLREIRISVQWIYNATGWLPLWRQWGHTCLAGLLVKAGCISGAVPHICILCGSPSPFLVQFVDNELNAPTAFAFDASEDLEGFFLFSPIGEAFGGDGKATE